MTVTEAIRTRVLAITGVSALIGTRAYSLKLPQGLTTFPAVRVQQVGTTEDMHLRGSSRVCRSRVQVDSVAKEASGADAYAQARTVDGTIHGPGNGTGLSGFAGTIAGTPDFEILAVLPADVREAYDPDELQQVKIMRDYFVTHRG